MYIFPSLFRIYQESSQLTFGIHWEPFIPCISSPSSSTLSRSSSFSSSKLRKFIMSPFSASPHSLITFRVLATRKEISKSLFALKLWRLKEEEEKHQLSRFWIGNKQVMGGKVRKGRGRVSGEGVIEGYLAVTLSPGSFALPFHIFIFLPVCVLFYLPVTCMWCVSSLSYLCLFLWFVYGCS